MSEAQNYDARSRARVCLNRLDGRPDVIGHDFIEARDDPTGQPTIEIAVDADAIPAGILRELGQAGLDVREASPRAEWMVIIATAGDPR